MPIKETKIIVEMEIGKETPGTVVYKAEAEYVTALYINKLGLSKPYPQKIEITIEEII